MAVKVFSESCPDYKSASAAALKLLDKLKLKIPAHGKVLLKPNLLMPASPEKAVTTHPAVVDGVCRWIRQHAPGATIYIGDSSGCLGLGGTKQAFIKCGLVPIAKAHNAELVPFEAQPIVKRHNRHAHVWPELQFPEIVVKADLIINLPKLKTHSLTTYTGAVKNLYGCLPGGIKGKGHIAGINPRTFASLLIDVYQSVMPKANLMDAVIGMEGHGPSNGSPKQTGYLLASEDAVALDAAALKLAMIPEATVLTQQLARARGLYPEYEIKGRFRPVRYKLPLNWKASVLNLLPAFIAGSLSSLSVQSFMKSPEISYDACTKCLTCLKVCPAKAISTKAGLPVIDHKKCIKCLCCQEQCPYGAIRVKQNALKRMLKAFRRESNGNA
jgi:uncharacterized protein (DUF362 family)/ferredoxin